MEEARAVLARLERIEALDREGAPPDALLPELRALVGEAEEWARRPLSWVPPSGGLWRGAGPALPLVGLRWLKPAGTGVGRGASPFGREQHLAGPAPPPRRGPIATRADVEGEYGGLMRRLAAPA